MRIPPRAVALAACALLLATACSAGGGAIGQGMASIVVPVPASPLPSLTPSSSPSPNGPSLLGTSVSGVYGGHARLTRSNVRGCRTGRSASTGCSARGAVRRNARFG